MQSLLQKFTKVVIKASTLLPSEDKVNLDAIHDQYEEALEQLDEWRLFFELQDERYPMPGFKVTKSSYSGTFDVTSPRANKDKPFDHHKFYVGYPLVQVIKKMDDCRDQYIRCVYDYFSTKYSLDIKNNSVTLLKKAKLTYMDIVDDIRTQFGGLNFNAIAKEQVTNRLREKIGIRSRAKLANKSLEMDSFLHTSGKFSYHCEKLKAIEDAVMFFERGHAVPRAMFNDEVHYNQYVDYTSDYSFINCDQLEGIRFFKNGKVILKFKSAQIAKSFYEYFDLDTLKESRW
jgi:hypothetical protein